MTVGFLNGICSFSLKFQTFSLLFPGYFFDRTIIYGYNYITDFDHWIAFALLGYIGGKMIWDALHEAPETAPCAGEGRLDLKELLMLAVATSIDALAEASRLLF